MAVAMPLGKLPVLSDNSRKISFIGNAASRSELLELLIKKIGRMHDNTGPYQHVQNFAPSAWARIYTADQSEIDDGLRKLKKGGRPNILSVLNWIEAGSHESERNMIQCK